MTPFTELVESVLTDVRRLRRLRLITLNEWQDVGTHGEWSLWKTLVGSEDWYLLYHRPSTLRYLAVTESGFVCGVTLLSDKIRIACFRSSERPQTATCSDALTDFLRTQRTLPRS